MANTITFKGREPIEHIIVLADDRMVNSADDLVHMMERPAIDIHFPINTDFNTLVSIYQDSDALSEIAISQDYTTPEEVQREATQEEKEAIWQQMRDNGEEVDETQPVMITETHDVTKTETFVHVNYIIKIGLSVQTVDGQEIWVMSLGQLSEADIALRQVAGVIAKKVNFLTFEEYQKAKIDQSKVDLANFFETHPLISNAYHNEWHKFNATEEHRNLFVTHYFAHTVKVQAGMNNDKMSWNISGQECVDWEDSEAAAFTIAMDAYVVPLVHAQQRFELAVKAAKTKEELDQITIDYATVPTVNGDPALVVGE